MKIITFRLNRARSRRLKPRPTCLAAEALCYIHTLMKVVSSLSDPDVPDASVVSIGNFDGLHIGHRKILKAVVQRSRQLGVKSVAMTFAPHPVQFLAPARAPKLISTLDQKIRLIENVGVDVLFLVHFNEAFAQLQPSDFVKRYLMEGLKARAICVGSNFNFGYKQQGTVETLKEFSAELELIEVPPVRVRGTLASSSRVRQLISAGSVSRACRLLGRWVQLEGKLVGGARRGRSVTVPTLNLESENELIPRNGVYITRISLDGLPFMDSVTNIGVRPTFNEKQVTIETFVLNEAVPADAGTARVDFLHRLRDEVKFESPEVLRAQIIKDVKRAQKFFQLLLRRLSNTGNAFSEGLSAERHSN
jgi:riboflavin kinase / FMN adenylyltransferase